MRKEPDMPTHTHQRFNRPDSEREPYKADCPACTTPTFTPGPWIFYADLPSTEPNWHIVTTANKMRVLANVHIEPGNAMDLANAHLIAAAPALVEALEKCDKAFAAWQVGQIPGRPEDILALITEVRAALAAAEGR